MVQVEWDTLELKAMMLRAREKTQEQVDHDMLVHDMVDPTPAERLEAQGELLA